MLCLLQWNKKEVKLLNNRVLNIAVTNNRIRERIQSYFLGFGRFGRSQLLTHSPNKLRSGMSWCWPSEGLWSRAGSFSPLGLDVVLAKVSCPCNTVRSGFSAACQALPVCEEGNLVQERSEIHTKWEICAIHALRHTFLNAVLLGSTESQSVSLSGEGRY